MMQGFNLAFELNTHTQSLLLFLKGMVCLVLHGSAVQPLPKYCRAHFQGCFDYFKAIVWKRAVKFIMMHYIHDLEPPPTSATAAVPTSFF